MIFVKVLVGWLLLSCLALIFWQWLLAKRDRDWWERR
jgi:hypothetical protein